MGKGFPSTPPRSARVLRGQAGSPGGEALRGASGRLTFRRRGRSSGPLPASSSSSSSSSRTMLAGMMPLAYFFAISTKSSCAM